jgi:hypothetical protein
MGSVFKIVYQRKLLVPLDFRTLGRRPFPMFKLAVRNCRESALILTFLAQLVLMLISPRMSRLLRLKLPQRLLQILRHFM